MDAKKVGVGEEVSCSWRYVALVDKVEDVLDVSVYRRIVLSNKVDKVVD